MPRSLHLAAAKAGLLGVSFPEEVGGQGGTLLDSVALQEAFFEAGGSSGLAAALFTGGIALPHMAAHGTPEQIDAFVRPTLAGEKIGVARDHRARRRVRRRGDPDDRRPRRRHLRRQRRQDLHHQRRPRRLRDHRGAHRRARPSPASACSSSRRARPGFTVDRALSKMGWHCSDTAELSFVDARVPATNLVGEENSGFYLIAEQFVVERIALAVHAYGIAARSLALTAAYCRERETFGKPLIANQVVQHKLVEMHRQVEAARTYTRDVAARHVAGRQRDRRGVPGQADRRRGVRRTSSTRPCSCTAAPATCTGPRWSGTTATPGSSASEEERPKCSPTCPPDCWDTPMNLVPPLHGEVSLHMDAPVEEVWALVSDVTRIGEFSPETFEARWTRGLDRPGGGRVVQGPREAQRRRSDVLVALPRSRSACPSEVFEFSVGTDDVTVNNWGYRMEPERVRDQGHRVLPARALTAAAASTGSLLGHLRGRTNQTRHAHHPRADEGGARVVSNRRGDAGEARRPRRPSTRRRSPAAGRSTSNGTTPAAS